MEIPMSREERIRMHEESVKAELAKEKIKESLNSDLTVEELEKKIQQLNKVRMQTASEIAIRQDPEFKIVKDSFDTSVEAVKINQHKTSQAITRKFQVSERYDTEITKLQKQIETLRDKKRHDVLGFEQTINQATKEKPELTSNLKIEQDKFVTYCESKGIAYSDFIKEAQDIISPPERIKINTEVGESLLDNVDNKFFVETVRKPWAIWKKFLLERGIVVALDRSGIHMTDTVDGVKAKDAFKKCTIKAI